MKEKTLKAQSPSNLPTAKRDSGMRNASVESEEALRLIRALPDMQRLRLVKKLISILHAEQTPIGSLPQNEKFEEYSRALPGAVDRIMAMVEKEQEIRLEVQEKTLALDRVRASSNILFHISLIAVAGVAMWKGEAQIGIVFGSATIISMLVRYGMDWWRTRTSSDREHRPGMGGYHAGQSA